jgi:sugar (pentulose or hexulose) kinase
MDAAVGLKLHPDFDTAIREMTRVGQVFEPDLVTHEIYNDLYTQIYQRMYPRLQPLYEAIRAITNRV